MRSAGPYLEYWPCDEPKSRPAGGTYSDVGMDLAAELAKYGPAARPPRFSTPGGTPYCRRLAQSHYENFTVVSRLFPRHLHQPLCNVYAYCRWADDLADEPMSRSRGRQRSRWRLLDWWERQLDAAYAGQATHPVFIALRETIQRVRVAAASRWRTCWLPFGAIRCRNAMRRWTTC